MVVVSKLLFADRIHSSKLQIDFILANCRSNSPVGITFSFCPIQFFIPLQIEFARRHGEAATKQVEDFWEGAKEKSAATTLSTTKWLTQSLSHATERMSKFAGPYLPETGRKSLTTANDYARDVARTFNEVKIGL